MEVKKVREEEVVKRRYQHLLGDFQQETSSSFRISLPKVPEPLIRGGIFTIGQTRLIISACCWRLNSLALNWRVCFQMGDDAADRWTEEEVDALRKADLEHATAKLVER